MFTDEECFLIFLYRLIERAIFTKMACQPFGGDPRYFSWMFDLMAEHLYFTFYNEITGTLLSQWLPKHLHACRALVHRALSDTAIFRSEYVDAEIVDESWIRHHFNFD